MTATRKNRKPAVVATIDKSEALALVKSGEVARPNKFRRPCHLCGEVVEAEKGVLGGNSTDGWWAVHEGGKCFTPARKRAPRKTAVVRKTDDFDEMVEAAIHESASKKKVAAETESAAMVDEPKVPVRGTRKVNDKMAAAKKTVARRTTRKAAPAPTAKRPVKRSAPKKVEPNVPAESASTEDDGPEFEELDATTKQIVEQIQTFIKNGALDSVLGMLDEAIGERLDAVDAATKPAAKKTTARKTTTTRASAADKVAPVKRAAKSTGSASASKVDVEIVKVPRPAKGRDYRINPTLKNKMAGLKITFKSYVADSENKKASVTLREEYNGKPAGTRVTIPTSSIVQDN
jgi:hypothetical protein